MKSSYTVLNGEGSLAMVQVELEAVPLKCAPIVSSYNDKIRPLLDAVDKLRSLKSLSSVAEAMTAFMQIIGLAKESLRKILLRGEIEDYADNNRMHCTARLVEMLNQYSDELHICAETDAKRNFLMKEIKILEETKGISLPNFLPHNAFLIILQGKVNEISSIPNAFVEKVWTYIEEVVISVLMRYTENYRQLRLSAGRAGHNLMAKMKERSIKWVLELVEMEKLTDYTCDGDYVSEWNKLMASQNQFIHGVLTDEKKPSIITIEGIGEVEVGVLGKFPHVLAQAYDLKMRMIAYWKVVLRRLVDYMALHLQRSVFNLVNKEMEAEIVNELMGPYGGGIERMLEESPAVAVKREKLNKSIKKLRDSKEVVAKIMDSIITYAKTLPDIVKKINDRLNFCIMELNKMPKSLSSVAEAMTAFMQIIGLAKESLRKILLRGEFEEYSDELHRCPERNQDLGGEQRYFTTELSSAQCFPHYLAEKMWIYIEEAVISVLMRNSENYYKLQLSARRAGHNLMAKMKERSIKWMLELVEMEKLTDYTCDADYVSEWNKLMASQNQFIHGVLTEAIEGIGEVEVGVLRKYPHVLAQAYDLKMRIIAYWKVVLRRFVDFMALHLQLSVNNLVNKEMEAEIVNELMGPYGGGIERMLEESPAVAVKREKLNKSIKKLRDSKEVVAKIMDRIITYGGVKPETKQLVSRLPLRGFGIRGRRMMREKEPEATSWSWGFDGDGRRSIAAIIAIANGDGIDIP
ncbi:unnamed protein product [Malus baccata var. baccata]